MSGAAPQIAAIAPLSKVAILIFWTAGSVFQLWMGEQMSERGIGNGVSLMIFAGIALSLPYQAQTIFAGVQNGTVSVFSVIALLLIFVLATWFIVYFTTAQRKIPIQHMRRQVGTKVLGGQTNYLPLTLNMAGVIPIIFAISLVFMPSQFASMLGGASTPAGAWLENLGSFLNPGTASPVSKELWFIPKGLVGCVFYTGLIFFFNYFYTALQYNVQDIADNMKRQGSFIPGVRPGKQTRDFLDGVIGRITFVGASFIAIVALLQYVAPSIARINATYVSVIGGTSLLIMVSVALETMRQIEANVLMRQYNQ
jgi:preprotein translocase subunit SecY